MEYLYVSLNKPIEFGVWDECSEKKPMGWHRADRIIDSNYEFNKLDVLSDLEINQIIKRNKEFALKQEGVKE
jgi:hypothetical protein